MVWGAIKRSASFGRKKEERTAAPRAPVGMIQSLDDLPSPSEPPPGDDGPPQRSMPQQGMMDGQRGMPPQGAMGGQRGMPPQGAMGGQRGNSPGMMGGQRGGMPQRPGMMMGSPPPGTRIATSKQKKNRPPLTDAVCVLRVRQVPVRRARE